jgi:hypothetical protein
MGGTDVEGEPSCQKSIGIVPMVVAQVPVGILAEDKRESTEAQREGNAQCNDGNAVSSFV